MKHLLIFVFTTILITACGGDEEGSTEKQAMSSSSQKAMQTSETTASGNTADGKMEEGMMIVDHTMDEIEFEIRRSLNSVKAMIQQYKEEGFDTADLEAKKEKLEKELEELLNK